jgi:hypothetical protein
MVRLQYRKVCKVVGLSTSTVPYLATDNYKLCKRNTKTILLLLTKRCERNTRQIYSLR